MMPWGLLQEWNIGWDTAPISPELIAETRSQQAVLDPHPDLRPHNEHDRCQEQHREWSDHKTRAPQHEEHGSVDGMAHQRIGAGGHKFMVGVQTGIDSPLPSERTSGGAGNN